MTSTAFFLMAQYSGTAVIPLADVCRDYFAHLTPEKMIAKIGRGEIALPLVRIEASQKASRGVPLVDLAAYLDQQIEEARAECKRLTR
jgi:hypothetical protein